MGNQISSTIPFFKKPEDVKVLIVGLDAAGKTTLLYKLKLRHERDPVVTIPTIGTNIETLTTNRGYIFTGWDVGGRSMIRPLWRQYYHMMNALIFVIDSNDRDRIDLARDELHRLINDPGLENHPLLVYCNKQDLPNAMSPSEISDQIGLADIRNRPVLVTGCVATTGKGLEEGLFFLKRTVDSMKHIMPTLYPNRNHDKDKNRRDLVSTRQISEAADIVTEAYNVSIQLGYEATKGNATLEHFSVITKKTECPFAKAAKLWGGASSNTDNNLSGSTESLKDQAKRHAQALEEFVRRSNRGEKLDGFCIELDDPRARDGGPEELGDCVRIMLSALADIDPSLFPRKESATTTHSTNIMRVNYIGSRGWRFRFCDADFFVTSFAPCYPPASSRYGFGAERAFLLLQPENSFARHNLPPDTPVTNWDNPQTIRDKTRVAFHNAGRGYFVPDTTTYPMAEHIVKPLQDDGVNVVRWWQTETFATKQQRV
jgi:small GTP-binding protein